MGKASSLRAACFFLALSSTGCQWLLGTKFEEFELEGRGTACVEACPQNHECVDGNCRCSNPQPCGAHECGGFIEPNCAHPVECGACPPNFECTNAGNGEPNKCTPVNVTPCRPQTCAELGQTSGVHFSCGILVDCNPLPDCDGKCADDQVCTATGCCTPKEPTGCGKLPDGCGRVVDVTCKGDAVCVDGECCLPTEEERQCVGSACGLNLTGCPGFFTECRGACGEGEGMCVGTLHPSCNGTCPGRQCPDPAVAVCGLNNDGCDGQIQCFGRCPNPTDVCTSDFNCCTPHCPTMPTACGANDDGCGSKIQCPGPCPAGSVCTSSADGTFACTQ